MFGREVTQPIDLTFGILTANRKDKDIVEYVQNLIIALNLTHNVARENLKASQGRQKKDYDLRSKQKSYSIGDAVYKRDTATKLGQSKKLKPPWKGPYIVVKVINPVLYEIEDRKRSYVIHHDRLKLCTDKDLPIWIQRRRTNCMDQLKDTTPSEMTNEDIYDLSPLFSDSTQLTSDGPMLRNDIHFVQGLEHIRSGHLDRGTADQLKKVRGLADIHEDDNLDETFLYDFEGVDVDTQVDGREHHNLRRNRKKPTYLNNYTE